MVQRFFFDLTDGLTTIRDVDGVLVETLTDAIRQAKEVLQEMRYNAELSIGDEAWAVIIRDAVGAQVMVLSVIPRDPDVALAS